MSEIIVTVKPDATVKVHAEGIQGTACSLHTLPFINALGVKVAEEPLPEMFQTNTNTQEQEIQH